MAPPPASVGLMLAMSLALAAVTSGADHEVQQVKGPHVVSHALGPLMEVSGGLKPNPPREQREASYPSGGPCYSCSYGGKGHSAHDGVHSSRQEMRTEQRYVNGQPVYDLFHERRYKDGRIVHDQKVEKDEDDFGYRPGSSTAYPRQSSLTRNRDSNYGQHHDRTSYRHQPSYGSYHSRSQTYGSSHDHSNVHDGDEHSNNFERDFARMQEKLRRQMMSLGSQQPRHGGSHRSEYSSQTRYVNGQPVYKKKEERKFRDGQLIHENTEEKGPEDFGTEDVVRRYDANGALITDGSHSRDSYWRQWETREHSSNHNTRPAYTPRYSYSQEQHSSSATHPTRFPTPSSSSTLDSQTPPSRYPHETPYYRGHQPRYNQISSERHTEEVASSSYSPRRPSYTIPSTYDTSRSDYNHNTYEDGVSSSEEETRHTPSSSSNSPYHPSSYPSYSSSSSRSREEFSNSYSRPSSGQSSIHYREHQTSQSFPDSDVTQQTQTHPTDDLELTHVQQTSRTPENDDDDEGEHPSPSHVQHNSESSYHRWEPSERRQPQRPDIPGRPRTSSTSSRVSETKERVNYRDHGHRENVPTSSSPQSPDVGHVYDMNEPNQDSGEDLQQRVDIDDEDNSGRYDINPLEDGYVPAVPSVDNEMVSSHLPPPTPREEEPDSNDITRGRGGASDDESPDLYSPHVAVAPDNRRESQVWSSNSHEYSSVRGSAGDNTRPAHRIRPEYSQTSSYEETSNIRPVAVGSRHFQYNETRHHSSVVDDHHEPFPEDLPGSVPCTQANGCIVVEAPQTISRSSEIRTTYRYVNGRLVGMSQHERQYENDNLVFENTTEHGRDEVASLNLGEFSGGQLDLPHDSFRPDSFSQKHEIREEKTYVNGQQIYDLHHERHFEDGKLVHDRRIQLDEDDLREHEDTGRLGVVQQSTEETEHRASHTYHGPGAAVGGVDGLAQTHQVSDNTPISSNPTYTSRRFESHQEKEFVNGQPVYSLHHERLYNNGSLVYDNKTEQDQDDLKKGPHHDALHNILAGNTLATASQSTYARAETGYYGPYGNSRESPYSGESYRDLDTSPSSDTYGQRRQSYGHYGESTGTSSQSRETYDQNRTYGQSVDSYGGNAGSRGTSATSEARYPYRSSSQDTVGTDLASHNPGSGRATTTILGGSGALLTGSGSLRSGTSVDSASSREEVGGSGRSGCLTCVLLAGSEHSHAGGVQGTDTGAGSGHSQRHEMNREEHYENGQLIHGQEQSRMFKNGELVHQNSRQYADRPGSLYSQEADSHASASVSSIPSYSSAWSSWSSWSSSGSGVPHVRRDVCRPNPCLNGGTCLTGVSGPVCTCHYGFSGSRCEQVV